MGNVEIYQAVLDEAGATVDLKQNPLAIILARLTRSSSTT